ncbi:MAG: hypothetical protein ACLGPL_05335 [Acidobacteriota bacterium]
MENGLDLKKEYQITAIVSGAMMASTLIYAIVVEFIRMQHTPFTGFAPQSLGNVKEYFYVMPLFWLFVIKAVRGAVAKAGQDTDPRSTVNRLRMATIVTFALCEVPALFGLVLFLLGGLHSEFYLMLAFSLVGMLLYFPRYNHWEVAAARSKVF